MTITEPTSGTTPWNQNALYAVVNGTGGTEITDQINARICPAVGKNFRTTNSSAFAGTNVRILSTRAAVRTGRSYQVVASGEIVVTTGGAATVQNEIRFTTDDTEPTTGSTMMNRGFVVCDPGGIPVYTVLVAYFDASANGFLRPVVCSQRASGSVNCQWNSATGRQMFLEIFDIGPTISTSGTVY